MAIIGRVLLAVLFVFSGITKLLDPAGTADTIASKVVLPPTLTPLVDSVRPFLGELSAATGMTIPYLGAGAAGVIEVFCGLMIMFNIGARVFALILVLFTIAATVFFHDFWNLAGAERGAQMIHALKNLSIIGGLFLVAAGQPLGRADETGFGPRR